ncbi:MAG: alpha-L-rhamnosidase C-terminal domain-containing protein [Gemmatimonadota bacterium]|jgi:hypothetical protein
MLTTARYSSGTVSKNLILFLALIPVSFGCIQCAPPASQEAPVQVADINPELLDQPWEAGWITPPTADPTAYGVYHFRRTFDLDSAPESFVIHVSGDNRYRLFVNGRSVAVGPARGDLQHWNFLSIDIGPYLSSGPNVLSAVVWNFANQSPIAQVTFETGLLVQGNSELESVVNTNGEWKVIQNPAYSPISTRGMVRGYFAAGAGEQVDGPQYIWGWQDPSYDDSEWLAAEVSHVAYPGGIPIPEEYAGWHLVPREIPMMEEREIRIPSVDRQAGIDTDGAFLRDGSSSLTVPANTTATLLLDQEELVTAYPVIQASGGRDARITLTYAEALVDADGQKGNRDVIEGKEILGYQDVFVPDGGTDRTWQSLWFRTWRYLQMDVETGDEPLTIQDMHAIYTAYPFQENGAFASSEPSLADIWEVGWRTARLCAFETYADCPYYEQLQYIGDTRIQTLISLYVSGDDRLMRQAITAFDHSRIPEGITRSRYPDRLQQLIPTYSLIWIAMVHDYWLYRGDDAYLQGFLPGIRGVVDWYEQYIDDTGMLGGVPHWNFVDYADGFGRGEPPGASEGNSSVTSLQFAYALDYAAELSADYGRAEEADHYRELSEGLKEATYRLCWDEGRQLVADTPEKTLFSQHANTLAVLTDAIPEGRQADLMRRILDDGTLTQATYYFRFYVDAALQKTGLADLYVDRLQPWHTMLDLGLTTFAEKPEPARSDAHAWSAVPNYGFLALVCGIQPAEKGFRSVFIEPALGTLDWIEGTMPHQLGEIRVDLRKTDSGGVSGSVTLPEGLTGTFRWGDSVIELPSGQTRIGL